MIDDELIKKEFSVNGLSPFAISVKYGITIEMVYDILKTMRRTPPIKEVGHE